MGALLALVASSAPGSPARAEEAPSHEVGRIYLDDLLPAPDGQRTVELQLRAETSYGKAVAGLRARDLEVRDNGKSIPTQRTTLTPLSGTRRGTACVIAIDTSRTMKGEPFAAALEAARSYLERMEEQDRLALVTFADRVEVVFGFDVAREEARRRLEALAADEDSLSTLLFDGLFQSVELLRDAPELPRRRFAIAFADGRDQGSHHNLEEVVARARGGEAEPRVPVFSVGYARFGGDGLENLERLAGDTAARAFEASTTLYLATFFEEIRQRMLGTYILRYTASMDGEHHAVDVAFDGKQDTRSAVYPDLREPIWPLALGAIVLLTAGVSALLYQRRRHRRSNAVDRPAACEMREVATAHDESAPALPEDRVIMP
jgi:hypothetical protein